MKFKVRLGCQVNYADIEHKTYKVRMFSLLTREVPYSGGGTRSQGIPYYFQVGWWGKEQIPKIRVGTSPVCPANLPITLLNTHAVGQCPHCKPLKTLDEAKQYVKQIHERVVEAVKDWEPTLTKEMPADEEVQPVKEALKWEDQMVFSSPLTPATSGFGHTSNTKSINLPPLDVEVKPFFFKEFKGETKPVVELTSAEDKALFKKIGDYWAEAQSTIEKTAKEPGVKSDRKKVPA